MAGFFRMEVKVVSRQSIRSNGMIGTNSALNAAAYIDAKEYMRHEAISASAYISGQNVISEDGFSADYSHRSGVECSFVCLPEGVPEKYAAPEVLWNEVEQMEKGKNACLFHEMIICFDRHLSFDQRMQVAKEFGQFLNEEGMIAHIALHSEKEGNGNYHMHVLCPTRSFENGEWDKRKVLPRKYLLDEEGNQIPLVGKDGKQKRDKEGRLQWKRERVEYVRAYNDYRKGVRAKYLRKAFCDIENRFLEPENQVSHLSYRERGIDRIPGKHIGKAAFNVYRKLKNRVDKLPPEVKDDFLNRIDNLFEKKAGLGDDVEKNMVWHEEYDSLKEEIKNALTQYSSYQPSKYYVKEFDEKRTQMELEYAFHQMIKFQMARLNQAKLQQETVNNTMALLGEVMQAIDDLLIMFSTGLTQSMEQRLYINEYELKKDLLKNISEEINRLEGEIKQLKEEDENVRRIEEKLSRYRERVDELAGKGDVESVRTTGHDDSKSSREIEKIGRSVSRIATELQPYYSEMERAGRRTAELRNSEVAKAEFKAKKRTR